MLLEASLEEFVCSKCEQPKPASEFYVYKRNGKLRPYCKQCYRILYGHQGNRIKYVERIRREFKKLFSVEATNKALIRLMRESPELWDYVFSKYKHRFRQLLKEERLKLLEQHKRKTVLYNPNKKSNLSVSEMLELQDLIAEELLK